MNLSSLLVGLSPMFAIGGGASLLMVADAARHKPGEERASADLAIVTAIVHFAATVFAAALWVNGVPEGVASSLAPHVVLDKFTIFFCGLLGLAGGLSSLVAGGYLPEHRLDRGEFYHLMSFSTLGAMMLVSAGDMLTLFIGLETMSLGIYALTGFRRGSARSSEASVKYFLTGSFAAAILVYGAALLYGATGTTSLAGIGSAIAGGSVKMPLVVIGLVLVVVGAAFKVSAVPFHMWTPDAYEGAPTPATTYMATVVKAAAFAMLLRLLFGAFGDEMFRSTVAGWPALVAALSVLTMTVANFTAGRQESVKRMLAYSSVAHAGYVLVALAASGSDAGRAQGAMLFYLVAYTAATIGAFGTLVLCGSHGKEAVSYEDLAGLGKRHPGVAFFMSLFLLSLAGVPPLAGFFGKLGIIEVAIRGDHTVLAIVLLLNSVLAAYYYLRVMVYMYMREPAAGAPIAVPMKSGYVVSALIIASLLTVAIGFAPATMVSAADQAVLVVR